MKKYINHTEDSMLLQRVVDRPLIHRYGSKLRNNYRVPQEAKFLIILPELDVKGYKSPSTKRWLNELDSNTIIPRELLHITFFSDFYGIIPFELSYSFPMGQYESIDILEDNNKHYKNLEQKLKTFFELYGQHYNKCGVLVPERYINQFDEETNYSKRDIIIRLLEKLRLELSIKISIFNELSVLLESFMVE